MIIDYRMSVSNLNVPFMVMWKCYYLFFKEDAILS